MSRAVKKSKMLVSEIMLAKWNFGQTETCFKTHTDLENELMVARRKDEARGGIVGEFGMDMYPLLYLKWISNKDLHCGTWNSTQCYAWMEGALRREWIHVYVWLSPFLFTWHFNQLWVHAQSLQLCLTLCNPMDCYPPGSSVYGILQARILECIAMPSRKSSWLRDWTWVSYISCIGRWVLYH